MTGPISAKKADAVKVQPMIFPHLIILRTLQSVLTAIMDMDRNVGNIGLTYIFQALQRELHLPLRWP